MVVIDDSKTYLVSKARHTIFLATCGASMTFTATPTFAIDCRKVLTRVDSLICADASLMAADAALGAAYFKLLKSTGDKEIHDLLIVSRRRWLKARDEGDSTGAIDGDKALVLAETRDRTSALSAIRGSTGTPGLVEQLERQREFASHYTGGPFSGYETSCWSAPH